MYGCSQDFLLNHVQSKCSKYQIIVNKYYKYNNYINFYIFQVFEKEKKYLPVVYYIVYMIYLVGCVCLFVWVFVHLHHSVLCSVPWGLDVWKL